MLFIVLLNVCRRLLDYVRKLGHDLLVLILIRLLSFQHALISYQASYQRRKFTKIAELVLSSYERCVHGLSLCSYLVL